MSSDRDYSEDEEYNSDEEDREYVEKRGREDDDGPPKKKRKTGSSMLKLSSLIDDEAEASDDESDDGEDGENYEFDPEFIDTNTEAQAVPGSNTYHRRIAHHLATDHDQVAAMAEMFNRRYAESEKLMEAYTDESDPRTPVAQQARQPSVKDPKLWLVKCVPGAEKKIASCLLQKALTLKEEGRPLNIFSVVTQDHLKGYIYIEAYREAHVREAITHMSNIYQRDVTAIELKEMVPVMSVPKKNLSVKKDDWVRCKKGLYSGDIGQVHHFDEAQQEVVVKLIPRLNVDDGFRVDEDDGGSRKNRKESRPPPQLFDLQKMQSLYGGEVESSRVQDGEVYYKFNNQKFKDGFLFKSIPIKSLQLGVKPKLEDISNFARAVKDLQGDDDDEDGAAERAERLFAAQARRLAAQESKVVFEKGDKVVVTDGELQGLIGEIQSVNGDVAEVVSKHKELSSVFPFSLSQLQKHFRVGDHVKVISGKFKGETGTIQGPSNDIAVVLTDLGLRELQVFTVDIQIASSGDISTGASLGEFGYKRHELVTIVPNTIGVIIAVDSDSVSVLDSFGKVKQVKVQSIKERKNSSRAVSSDTDGNPIGQGDLIRVIDGEHAGQSGSILHIFKYYAFVYNKTRTQDNGVFVVRAKSCKLQGTSKNAQQTGHGRKDIAPTQIGIRPTYGFGNKTRQKRNDPLLNKTAAIISGPYKGHVGVIKAATTSSLSVQLQVTNQKVQVPQAAVQLLVELGPGYGTPGREYFDGSATPSRGNQTPMHVSMTPIHRPSTPMHDYSSGGMTPSRGNSTPFHESSWGDIDTPATEIPVRTPGTSYPDTSTDYPTYADHRTPATPGTPGTPGTGLYTTPYDTYRAPTTPNTPGTSFASTSYPSTVYTPEGIYPPGTPSTPGGGPATGSAHYPGTPGTSVPYDVVNSPMDTPYTPIEDEYWWCVNAEVYIQDETNPYNGRMGYIKDLLGSMCVVGVYQNSRLSSHAEEGMDVTEIGDTTVSGDNLTPVRPEKKDTVIVIRGQCRHQIGKLIGVDAPDGIVNINESEINILKLENLARLADWRHHK